MDENILELSRKIENIIQDAEVAAVLDKGMYAEMDNQLMNRQTLLKKVKALVEQQVLIGRIDSLEKFVGVDDFGEIYNEITTLKAQLKEGQ
jgi:hypothetical protein